MILGKLKSILKVLPLKDIVYVGLILTIGFFGYRVWASLKAEIQRSNVAYKQLSETLARAQNEMVTKADLEAFAASTNLDLHKIKHDLSKLGADLTAVGETIASIEGSVESNQDSDSSQEHDPPPQGNIPCKLCDIHSYTTHIQSKDIKLGEMPHARVSFDASKASPWTIENDKIDVKVTTALGENTKKGVKLFYHTVSLINKSRPELAGKEFKLKITSSKFEQTAQHTKHWYWWAPHLALNVDNILTFQKEELQYSLGASLGFSVMAWGRSKLDNDLRVLSIGIGFDSRNNFYLNLNPIGYNIGQFLPIISDLWISGGAVWQPVSGAVGAGITIGTTL